MPAQIINPALAPQIAVVQDLTAFLGVCAAACTGMVSNPVTPPPVESPAHPIALADILAPYLADEATDRIALHAKAGEVLAAQVAILAAMPPTVDAP